MTLTTDGAHRISLLYEAAKAHGSLVSVDDLVPLMPGHVSEREIENAIRSHSVLGSRFTLESGYVVEKDHGGSLGELLSVERNSRTRASVNLRHAYDFVPLLESSRFVVVGVSGSTSYGSASRSRDLDLFCVAPSGAMWISLSKSLLLSRAFSLTRRRGPPICLSCIMDEDYARTTFSADQGALFARDALETIVLIGEPAYCKLLRDARWISDIYPAAFTKNAGSSAEPGSRQELSTWAKVLNQFLFTLVGTYIEAKSLLLNRRLAGRGSADSNFALRKGVDHLIYESARYAKLRNHYSAVSRVIGAGPTVEGVA